MDGSKQGSSGDPITNSNGDSKERIDDCCIVFTTTNMLLRAAYERENGTHQKNFRKKVYGL
jgi:hypothetical protein